MSLLPITSQVCRVTNTPSSRKESMKRHSRKSRFSSGIKHTQAYSDNEYSGTLNYNTQMKQADTYAYAQYNGKWKKDELYAGG